jgi:hypothetical protein
MFLAVFEPEFIGTKAVWVDISIIYLILLIPFLNFDRKQMG